MKHITSIPGVGVKLSSRLIGEIENIDRFKTESQIDRSIQRCGIIVQGRSGKLVYQSNKICKMTMVAIACCLIRNIPEYRVSNDKKRAEGKSHNHALRCLSRQLVKVIFKMLKEDRDYKRKNEIKKAA